MRKITNILLIIAALTAQIMAGEAQAVGLAGFSPNNATITNPGGAVVSIPGLPAWYQGQDGISVKPCLDVAACVLVGAPDFNAALPMSYPTNFPSEAFYMNATNASIPVGTANALVVMALEFTFVDPFGALTNAAAPGAVAAPFQRLRLVHTFAGGGGTITPAPPANSNFTVRTPWGTTVFPLASAKCVNSGGDTKCSMTRDIVPAAFPSNPAGALAATIAAPDSGINTFLRDPAAPAGFLGTGAAVLNFVGAPAGHLNSITVTDPLGQTGTTTQLTTLTGQTIGIDVQPGTTINMGPAIIAAVTPPVPTTVTVTNTTANPVTFPALATVAGADKLDFAVVATAVPAAGVLDCLTATVPSAGKCSFDITFSPTVAVAPAVTKALRAATITLTGTTVQPVPPVVPPLTNPPAVTVNLSGTAQFPLAVTVATSVTVPPNTGTGTVDSTPAGIAKCAAAGGANCTAGFDVGSTVTLTPTGATTPTSLLDVWTGACTGTGACSITMDGPKAVTADFIQGFNVTTSATPAAGGTITATQAVKAASTPTLTITPTATATTHYRLGTVTDNASPVTPVAVPGTNTFSYQLPSVTADHTVAATFVQQFILTPSITGVGGTIAPATAQTIDSGTTAQDFTVTPAAGYRIGTLVKDGVNTIIPPTAPKTQTVSFNPVTVDHTLSATFVKVWNVASTVTGNGSADKTGPLVIDDNTTPSITFTPASKKFKVGKILLDNAPQNFTKPATNSGAVTLTLPAVTADRALSAKFVPSGDLDENGTVDVNDALKALKIFLNLQTPDPTDLAAMKVGGLETVTIGTQISLVPNGGTGAPDLGDIILLLKRAVGSVTW